MNSRLLKISSAFFIFGAFVAFSNNASAQCDDIELEVTSDFDHICSGDSLNVIVNGMGEASCNSSAGNFTYCYGNNESTTFNFCPDSPGDGTMMSVTINSGTTEVNFDDVEFFDGANGTGISLGSFEGDLSGLEFTASNPDGCISFVLSSDVSVSCANGNSTALNYTIACAQVDMAYEIQWEPANLLTSPNSISTAIDGLTESTEFTVTVTSLDNSECVSSASVMVNYVSDIQLGQHTTTGYCLPTGQVDLFSLLDGDPESVGYWLDPEGIEISNILNPETAQAGIYTHGYEGCEENSVFLDLTLFEPPVLVEAPAFDYYCEGEEIWVEILDEIVVNPCSEAEGSYEYCYINSDQSIFSYCPDSPDGPPLTISFSAGDLEIGFDVLTVYNGANAEGEVIDTFEGDAADRTYTSTDPSGCISFQITSDNVVSCQSSNNIDPLMWDIFCAEVDGNFTFDWSSPEYLLDPNAAATQIFGLDADVDFTVTVAPLLSPECFSTATVSVNYISNLNIGTDTEVIVCGGNEALNLFETLEGNPDQIGAWTDDQGNPVANTFLPPGNSSTLFYYTHPSCVNSTELLVNAGSIPNISAGTGTSICEGQSTTLTATGGVSYEWIGIGNSNPVVVTPDVSTTYTVIGYDAFGCYAEDDITIGVINTDAFEITDVDGVLSVDGGDDVQWYLNGFPILGATGPTLEYSFPGTYTASIDTGGQCDLISEPYVVIISGVSELEAYTTMYPQPVQSSLIIESKEAISSIQIISIDGKLVQTEVINEYRATVNCSGLQYGTYVVQIEFNNGTIIHKRMIKA